MAMMQLDGRKAALETNAGRLDLLLVKRFGCF
jgi:hypothetical protein